MLRIYTSGTQFGLVSKFESLLTQTISQQLAVCRILSNDLSIANINWSRFGPNIWLAYRNPDHQTIHYNFVMRTNLTPKFSFHQIILAVFSVPRNSRYMYAYDVRLFWWSDAFWYSVASALSLITGKNVPFPFALFLLNDDSERNFRFLVVALS